MFDVINLFLIFGIGASLGFFGGLFGIGGGIIAVPLLAIGFGMDQALAQGTALVLMVPNLLVGWWRYSKRHPVSWRAVIAIASSAMLTTWLIAHMATQLAPDLLRWGFSLFLCILAIKMFKTSNRNIDTEVKPLNIKLLPVIGAVGGSSMGFLGIGGGLVAAPLISGWLGQRQTTAQGLALALVAPSSVVALATYAQAQRVDWLLGLPMALGGLFTVSAGVALAHRLPERKMRMAFSVILFATACWLVVSTLI